MKSISQKTCCKLFVTHNYYIHVCQLEKESYVVLAMKLFTKDIGVPKVLVTDGVKA